MFARCGNKYTLPHTSYCSPVHFWSNRLFRGGGEWFPPAKSPEAHRRAGRGGFRLGFGVGGFGLADGTMFCSLRSVLQSHPQPV